MTGRGGGGGGGGGGDMAQQVSQEVAVLPRVTVGAVLDAFHKRRMASISTQEINVFGEQFGLPSLSQGDTFRQALSDLR